MDTALAELGNVHAVPSFTKAMKGYIAMSRVTKAHDLLLTQPFSPALFRQGPQPWPTLLRDVLRGTVPEAELAKAALSAEKSSKKPVLLKDLRWRCGTCETDPEGDYTQKLSVGK